MACALLKHNYISQNEISDILVHLGVPVRPSAVFNKVRETFSHRLRQRRSQHLAALRKIIGEATGIDLLSLSTPSDFMRLDPKAVRIACQKAAPWDTVKFPFEITFLREDKDPYGSPIFATIVDYWKRDIPRMFGKNFKFPGGVPCLEEWTLICRVVRKKFFSCFCTCVFYLVFFPTDCWVLGFPRRHRPIRLQAKCRLRRCGHQVARDHHRGRGGVAGGQCHGVPGHGQECRLQLHWDSNWKKKEKINSFQSF